MSIYILNEAVWRWNQTPDRDHDQVWSHFLEICLRNGLGHMLVNFSCSWQRRVWWKFWSVTNRGITEEGSALLHYLGSIFVCWCKPIAQRWCSRCVCALFPESSCVALQSRPDKSLNIERGCGDSETRGVIVLSRVNKVFWIFWMRIGQSLLWWRWGVSNHFNA